MQLYTIMTKKLYYYLYEKKDFELICKPIVIRSILVDSGGFVLLTFFLNENKMYSGHDRITLIESQL